MWLSRERSHHCLPTSVFHRRLATRAINGCSSHRECHIKPATSVCVTLPFMRWTTADRPRVYWMQMPPLNAWLAYKLLSKQKTAQSYDFYIWFSNLHELPHESDECMHCSFNVWRVLIDVDAWEQHVTSNTIRACVMDVYASRKVRTANHACFASKHVMSMTIYML